MIKVAMLVTLGLMVGSAYAKEVFTKDDMVGTWQCHLFIEEMNGSITKSQNMSHLYADGCFVAYSETRQIHQGTDIKAVLMSSQGDWKLVGKKWVFNMTDIHHMMLL